MTRLFVAAALGLLALLALAATLVIEPRPDEFATLDAPLATDGQAEAPRALLVRGPAIARYDAQNGTTEAWFLCGDTRCTHTVRLAGDARAEAAAGRVLLLPPGDALVSLPREGAPLDETADATPARTLEGLYATRDPGEGVRAWVLTLVLLAAAILVALGRPALTFPPGVGFAPGLAAAHAALAAGPTGPGNVLVLLILPTALLAAGLGVATRRYPRIRPLPLAAAGLIVGYLAGWVALGAYY